MVRGGTDEVGVFFLPRGILYSKLTLINKVPQKVFTDFLRSKTRGPRGKSAGFYVGYNFGGPGRRGERYNTPMSMENIRIKTKRSANAPFCAVIDSFVDLRFGDRADGAAVFARTAVDALVRIDDILAVALGDRRHRAGVCARSARNAFIADNSCHGFRSFQRIGLPTAIMIAHAPRKFNRLNEKHAPRD